jgi:hypothetical protein
MSKTSILQHHMAHAKHRGRGLGMSLEGISAMYDGFIAYICTYTIAPLAPASLAMKFIVSTSRLESPTYLLSYLLLDICTLSHNTIWQYLHSAAANKTHNLF